MNVIVTGGAGYIGSIAVERLLERGDRVTVLDNLWRGHAKAIAESVELIQLDIRDAAGVDTAIASVRPDAVMHFAAATIVPESITDPAEYYSINVSGALNVLSAMRRAGVGRFVFSSTAAVYGEPRSDVLTESSPLCPINPYGISKHVGEQLLPAFEDRIWAQQCGVSVFQRRWRNERSGRGPPAGNTCDTGCVAGAAR